MSKDVKTKLEQLNKLLSAASSEAIRWGERNNYDTDTYSGDEEYLQYRNSCFEKVETPFWKIAKSLGMYLEDYHNYENVEQEMRGVLREYESNNPYWLLDVIEEIDVD